ncbi:MAG TPA: hypothetical protein VGZ32_04590 [Actinocrinis sp.]|jgi:hypothetical protein|uniref:hypothetical protein n=1 Tax=Actinocrinis sp. TaxID=1920516 RepID=UPI002DDD9795|nr:hypothetical protein [Actinocrinis sp.]HEV3169589.1 hypothetical protein [Actinocrinis sp.]
MALNDFKNHQISRRNALKAGFGVAAAAQLAFIESAAFTPARALAAATANTNAGPFPIIQFDIGNFIAPPVTLNDGAGNVTAQFGPVFSYFVPAKLTRCPTPDDQLTLDNALNQIEEFYDFSPSGIFVFTSYGVPYFNKLPCGINGPLVQEFMPQILDGQNPDGTTNVLAEAVPMPTDVVGGLVGGPGAPVPNVTKDRFNVNLVIENNDMVFHMRSDSLRNLNDVLAWLKGSCSLHGCGIQSPQWNGLMRFGTTRVQFVQRGLPRQLADQNGFEFAPRVNPDSPMWMGFLDQQTNAAGPAQICTFAGNSSATLTTATQGDYFGQGSIMHFSHVIEDLFQFYATPNQDPRHSDGEDAAERMMYAFRANQIGTPNGLPAPFNAGDPFTNGGCPAFINNRFQGPDDAALGAQDAGGTFNPNDPASAQQTETFTGLGRIGHNAGLQRSSRAADGTPIHIRMDGPGFSTMDVPAFQDFPGGNDIPAGSQQPKLQFAIFIPTAEFFRQMRTNVAAQDLQVQYKIDPDDNGLERFITATRRQNFLVPPRPRRAFPLVEYTDSAKASTTARASRTM